MIIIWSHHPVGGQPRVPPARRPLGAQGRPCFSPSGSALAEAPAGESGFLGTRSLAAGRGT